MYVKFPNGGIVVEGICYHYSQFINGAFQTGSQLFSH